MKIMKIVDTILERRLKEVDITGGLKVDFASDEHVSDLKKRIDDLRYWRDLSPRGTEKRANYSRLIQRLNGELKSAQRQQNRTEHVQLSEGGAVGHLYHPYDNRDLTFAEIKDFIESAAEGRLQKVSEKFDGMNIVFTFNVSEGQLKVARNSGDIKRGGMDASELAKKFFGRGNVEEAFNSAFDAISSALMTIDVENLDRIFGENGNRWYSAEIIYAQNPNVLNYDGNNVVVHQWPIFDVDDNGNVDMSDDASGVDILTRMVDKLQLQIRQREWRINGPAIIGLKKLSDGTISQRCIDEINSAMQQYGVHDDDTLGDYMMRYVLNDIDENFGDTLNSDVKTAIAARILELPGAQNLTQIKKMVKTGNEQIVEYVKNGATTLKQSVEPFENAIHRFGTQLLRTLKSTIISNPGEETSRLKSELMNAMSNIENSGDERQKLKAQQQFKKMENPENISPIEGIVFIYKGNAYKFTGSFAPLNQILGLFKYGR